MSGAVAPALRWRSARGHDQQVLRELWASTFPALVGVVPAVELPTGERAAGATCVVGEDPEGAARAAALALPVPEEPAARRLHVLAPRAADWRAARAEAAHRLRAAGVERWYALVREDCADVLSRHLASGEEVVARSWGASLDLRTADREALEGLVARVRGTGVRVERLGAGDAGAAHALFTTHRGDFPRTPATTPSPLSVSDVADLVGRRCSWGAWEGPPGGRLLALTVAVRRDDGVTADVDFTVTDRGARRRGLAAAVKAACVLDLAEAGVLRVRTGGAQVNEASLAANRRLGFGVDPLWVSLVGR